MISYLFQFPLWDCLRYIKNFNPPILTPGQNVFVSTNKLTFTVSSLISTVATNNIHTYINGVSVPETFTGSSSNWTVSVPLNAVANQPSVTFAISAVDNNGLSNGVAGTFDTFSQNNLMIEAGDFDFNSGQWIDNPIEQLAIQRYGVPPTAIIIFPAAISRNTSVYGVDYTTTNVTRLKRTYYRQDGNYPWRCFRGRWTETNSDFLRSKLINMGPSAVPPFEYVPGEAVRRPIPTLTWAGGRRGTWINYTRTFPSNTYRSMAGWPTAGPIPMRPWVW